MKRLAVLVTFFILASSQSLASTAITQKDLVSRRLSASKTRMPTKNVLVLAVPKHQRKFVVTNEIDDDSDDLPGPDELDLQVLYARPRVVEKCQEQDAHDDELSEYVTVRLAVARAKALKKYREIHNL